MSAARTTANTSINLVRKTLLENGKLVQFLLISHPLILTLQLPNLGPCTTQSLHSILHSLPEPLPSRKPPSNFLQGITRSLLPESAQKVASKAFPGQSESTEGTWSMRYLKQGLLARMEERGEIVKLTRSKWENLSGTTSTPVETEQVEEVKGLNKKQTKNQAQQAAKKEAEFVWVVKDEFEKAMRDRRENGDSGRTPKDTKKGEEDLKRRYGLEQ